MAPNNQPADPILSKAKKNFEHSKREIEHLLKIHKQMDEIGGRNSAARGRRSEQIQVLHRPAIVMIIACWQDYIQDRFREFFQYLLDHSDNDPQTMPHDMKSHACRKIKENKDISSIWKFSGDGWKEMLKKYADEKLDKFSSPSTERIDELFKYLGIEKLSKSWSWQGMNNENAKEKLNEYIKLRNEIAHGQNNGEGDNSRPNRDRVEKCLKHIEFLIDKTEEAVRNHVETPIGQDADK